MPHTRRQAFRCFWSVPSGWGSFTHTLKPQEQRVTVQLAEGTIALQKVAVNGLAKGPFSKVSAHVGKEELQATMKTEAARRVITFDREIALTPDHSLEVVLTA
jgi:hypothetical protein